MDDEVLRSAWLASEGFKDSDEYLDSYTNTPAVTLAFVAICVRVARRLHENGVITGAFGRAIPIIVHELEYYDAILEETREANPPGVSDEFERYWRNSWDNWGKPSLGISDLGEVLNVISNSGFSAQVNSLAGFLQPSARIFICERDGTEKVGGVRLTVSHFGGLPTLPENLAWPTWNKSTYIQNSIAKMERIFERDQQKAGGSSEELKQKHQDEIAKKSEEMSIGESPLAFLGQLSLREIHAVAPMVGWPKKGILAFFYDPARIRGYSSNSRGHCRILFFPEDVPLRQLDYPELLGEKGRYPERALTARCEWTLDKYVQMKNARTPLREKKEYLELLEKLNADGLDVEGPVHRFGGYAQEIQKRLGVVCQVVTNGYNWGDHTISKDPRLVEINKGVGDWQLVMQFDSEISLDWWWGSAGRVYFMARRQDIKAGDFSNCWAILQCE
jgi:uncharacterized protein YwqG